MHRNVKDCVKVMHSQIVVRQRRREPPLGAKLCPSNHLVHFYYLHGEVCDLDIYKGRSRMKWPV